MRAEPNINTHHNSHFTALEKELPLATSDIHTTHPLLSCKDT